MTVFIIILAIILLVISVILLSKVKVFLAFHGELEYFVSFLGFKVFSSEKNEKSTQKTDEKKAEKKDKDNFFKRLQKKRGFTGAVKELADFALKALRKLMRLLKHFSFKKIFLDIKVATESAADTAIEYGAVCSAVYPLASVFNSIADVKFRKIDISADFNLVSSEIEFEFEVGARFFYLLIFVFSIFKEYRNFISRNDLNE